MTENTPPDENVPAASQTPDIMQALEELKAANAAIVQKLEAAEKKSSELEARVTALSAAKAGAPAPAEPEKSELDIAYEKALEELGIKKEK